MLQTRELYLEERRQAILDEVNQTGRVSVFALSHAYGVSEVTIRGDLKTLADRSLLVRTHGGAVSNLAEASELALASRRRQQVREKGRIGVSAAALVNDGDAVFLDSSSTSLSIAHHLKQSHHVTVITNSLAVVRELLDAPSVTVVMTGGTLDRATVSLVGDSGLEVIRRFNVSIGFFGAHGIAVNEGLTDVSPDVAAVKHPMVALCHEVVAVLDATKWGRVGVASFAALEDVNRVITTEGVPESEIALIESRGPVVQVAQ